jgi:nicotinamide mononucleotide adenylyltransferase
MVLLKSATKFYPIHAGHHYVANHYFNAKRAGELERALTVLRQEDLVTFRFKHVAQ